MPSKKVEINGYIPKKYNIQVTYVSEVMIQASGCITLAAELLGMNRGTLRNILNNGVNLMVLIQEDGTYKTLHEEYGKRGLGRDKQKT